MMSILHFPQQNRFFRIFVFSHSSLKSERPKLIA